MKNMTITLGPDGFAAPHPAVKDLIAEVRRRLDVIERRELVSLWDDLPHIQKREIIRLCASERKRHPLPSVPAWLTEEAMEAIMREKMGDPQ